MKKTIIAIAAACVALAACNKEQTPAQNLNREEGVISLNISCEESMTKADVTAVTDDLEYESNVNTVQIFVFGEDGKIQSYKNLGAASAATVSVVTGNKTVWAVVNHPDLSSIATLTQLEKTVVSLSANSTVTSKGFLMTGSSPCTVSTGSSVDCKITVSRLVSRVVLSKIENQCPAAYGTITVNRVFLSNVVANQQLDGKASPNTWYNICGRATNSENSIIDGTNYKAHDEALTYNSAGFSVAVGSSNTEPRYFYSYANPSEVESKGFVASPGVSGLQSKLVIEATVNGEKCYYPIPLDKRLERNCTYTVGVVITGPGSDDPDKKVQKGIINVTITPNKWQGESTYNEVI